MKSKKAYYLIFALFSSSITLFSTNQDDISSESIEIDPELYQELQADGDDLNVFESNNDSILDTPLYFATQSLYSFMKSRGDYPSESKTNHFNQSFIRYIKEVYNERRYAEYLSQDGTHLEDFFHIAQELSLDLETMYVSLRLFYNKIKECEFIDDSVILQILKPLPQTFQSYFDPIKSLTDHSYDALSFIKESIERTILNRFTYQFTQFQEQPDIFVQELADELAKIYQQKSTSTEQKNFQEELRIRLRFLINKFLETMLSKATWNITNPAGIWTSFMNMANELQNLALYQIIDHRDDLDDLEWSLVHRFRYFLELVGAMLPVSLFEEIEEALIHKEVFFLEVEEQDKGIRSKKELFLQSLANAKSKAIAVQKGIIL